MADAYGILTFTKSDDCEFDEIDLLNKLNSYEWNTSGEKWIWSDESKAFYIDTYSVQYPTTSVSTTDICYLDIEGIEDLVEVKYSDMKEEDWENLSHTEDRETSLEELVHSLGEHVRSGWIEIACVSNEKQRYVKFESLRIYSDLRGESKYQISGLCSGSSQHTETFPPNDVKSSS